MALIKCPECGAEISDKSTVCVHCGYPIKENSVNTTENTEESVDVPCVQQQTTITQKATRKKIDKTRIIQIVLLLLIGVCVFFWYSNKLSPMEERVYRVAEKYKGMLKDPDSMQLRGGAICVTMKNGDSYICFVSSGNNSYGAKITSTPMFLGTKYLGDYEDDLDETLSLDEQHDFLQARLIIATWNLVGDGMAKGEDSDYASADYVDCKKIARKLKCDYVKS